MKQRNITLIQELQKQAAQYVSTQSNRTSLITVTNTKLSNAGDVVTFLVSVFPESAEGPAIGFLMRNRGECKKYIKDHARINNVPHVEFALDTGEKNRQKVDELLSE
jgi:ribosome-binding factor A